MPLPDPDFAGCRKDKVFDFRTSIAPTYSRMPSGLNRHGCRCGWQKLCTGINLNHTVRYSIGAGGVQSRCASRRPLQHILACAGSRLRFPDREDDQAATDWIGFHARGHVCLGKTPPFHRPCRLAGGYGFDRAVLRIPVETVFPERGLMRRSRSQAPLGHDGRVPSFDAGGDFLPGRRPGHHDGAATPS